jgi:RNA polymerase sigma factor (sigma-70 family)
MDIIAMYIQSIKDVQMFKKEEEKILWEKMMDGREARRQLVESVLLFAFNLAKKWREAGEKRGIPLLDLVQTANAAAMHVVDHRFDPAKGRLTTILRFHVNRSIEKLIHGKDQLIKTPYYLKSNATKDHRFQPDAQRADKEYNSLDRSIPLVDEVESPLDRLCWNEMIEETQKKLEHLNVSDRDRAVFLEYICSGQTFQEIAKGKMLNGKQVERIINRVGLQLAEVIDL